MNRTFKKINKYTLCFWSRTTLKLSPLTLSAGRQGQQWGRGRSDHVGVSEHVLVSAGRVLLRPVDDGSFEEATTAQVEEGHEVPHYAQTVERRYIWQRERREREREKVQSTGNKSRTSPLTIHDQTFWKYTSQWRFCVSKWFSQI